MEYYPENQQNLKEQKLSLFTQIVEYFIKLKIMTKRESEAYLLSELYGQTSKNIATKMIVSEKTVESYLLSSRTKLFEYYFSNITEETKNRVSDFFSIKSNFALAFYSLLYSNYSVEDLLNPQKFFDALLYEKSKLKIKYEQNQSKHKSKKPQNRNSARLLQI
jgi:predicted DNA-binding protein (UPF0251 family)